MIISLFQLCCTSEFLINCGSSRLSKLSLHHCALVVCFLSLRYFMQIGDEDSK
jgi:hypothetical protein